MWHEGEDSVPNFTPSMQRVPSTGAKNLKIGLSNLNNWCFALRAMLQVKKKKGILRNQNR